MSHICFLRVGATPLFMSKGIGEFGGAEVRALTFARELARRGNQVDFAVAPHTDLVSETAEGIRVVPLPHRTRGWRKIVKSIRGRLHSVPQSFPAIERIEAPMVACFGVHQPTPQVIAAARATGKKSILFLTSSEDASPIAGRRGKRKRDRIQHNYAIRFADELIVQTTTQREQVNEHYDREATLIRNPINIAVHEDDLLQHRSHVLWVGRADTDSKRADLCFELARQRPEVPFRVVMNGGDHSVLQTLMASKPSNVEVDTFVPLSEVEQLYRTASVLINTSVSEGFPNAFLQAMKYRTPVLSLEVDPDGVLERYRCGETAGSLRRMAEKLDDFWPRNERAVEQGKRGRRYVKQHHALPICVDQLQTIIDRVSPQKFAA